MTALNTWVCPCCGATKVGEQLDIEIMAMQLPPLLATIVRALSDRQMTYEELAWAVYRGREPGHAINVLRATVVKQRDRLLPFGWQIVMPGQGRRGASLYLRPLTTPLASNTDPRTSSRAASGPASSSSLGRAAPKDSVGSPVGGSGPEPGQGGAVIPGSPAAGRTAAGGRSLSAAFSVPWSQEGFAHG